MEHKNLDSNLEKNNGTKLDNVIQDTKESLEVIKDRYSVKTVDLNIVIIDNETNQEVICGNFVTGGPNVPPVLGERCTYCHGDPGNGAGGYSGCCGEEVEKYIVSQHELERLFQQYLELNMKPAEFKLVK